LLRCFIALCSIVPCEDMLEDDIALLAVEAAAGALVF
jgi:hypothetical protein